jgi:shikimate kinase
VANCIGDVHLDRLGLHLTRLAGQEEQRSCKYDNNENNDHYYSRHRAFRSYPGDAGLLPDLRGGCIAPAMGRLADRLDRPIVLVGLMGAGKSTVGRRLAKRLGLPFVDSDDAIEDAAGYSAAEIYERYGEKDFRDGERRLVARLVDGSVRVIATGGGVYVDPGTRKLLNERAITVWLDAPVDILTDRTGRRDTRPLLRNADRKGTLERLSEERGPAYAEAHIRIRSGQGAHKDVVDAIVQAIETYVGPGSPGGPSSSGSGPDAKDRSSPA